VAPTEVPPPAAPCERVGNIGLATWRSYAPTDNLITGTKQLSRSLGSSTRRVRRRARGSVGWRVLGTL